MIQTTESGFAADVTFDSDFRRRFKLKRLALGLTQYQLAQYLKVSPSTVRKWEDGSIICCHDSHRIRIERFLCGDCDSDLQGRKTMPEALAARFRAMPVQMRTFIRKAALIHALSGNRADVRINLQSGIRGIIRRYAVAAVPGRRR